MSEWEVGDIVKYNNDKKLLVEFKDCEGLILNIDANDSIYKYSVKMIGSGVIISSTGEFWIPKMLHNRNGANS